MSTILFLNGCGSSGKTTLTRVIQHLSETPWLRVGIDSLIDMAPEKFTGLGERAPDGYFSFVRGENPQGETMRVELGPLAPTLFGLAPDLVRLLADQGNDVIVDEVLLDEEAFRPYAQALQGHHLILVCVQCDLLILQQREKDRGDRLIGLANDQFNRVHAGFRPYDLIVDTTHRDAWEVAREILDFVGQSLLLPDRKN